MPEFAICSVTFAAGEVSPALLRTGNQYATMALFFADRKAKPSRDAEEVVCPPRRIWIEGSGLVSEKSVAVFWRAAKTGLGVKSSERSRRPCNIPKSSDSLPSVAPTISHTNVRTPTARSAIKPRGMYLVCTDSSEPSQEGIELNSSFQNARSFRMPGYLRTMSRNALGDSLA